MSSAGSRVIRVGMEIVTFNAARAISELKNYENSLTRLDNIGMKTARDLGTSWAQIGSGVTHIRTLDTAVKTLNQTFNSSSPIIQRWAANFRTLGPQLQTPLNQARASMQQFTQTFTQASQRLIRDTQRIRSSFEQVGVTLQSVGQRVVSLNSQLRTTEASIRAVDTTVKTFNMDIDMMNKKLMMLDQNMQRVVTSAQALASSQTSASAGLRNTRTAIDETTDAANRQNSAFQNTMTTIVPYISRMMNFGLTLSMAAMAMDEANGMAAALGDSQEKVTILQERLNEAIERYGKNSRQAESLTRQLEDAMRGLGFMERNAGMAARDVTYFMILLATSIIGTVLPAFSNWKGTVEGATKAVDKLKGAMGGLIGLNAAGGLSKAFKDVPIVSANIDKVSKSTDNLKDSVSKSAPIITGTLPKGFSQTADSAKKAVGPMDNVAMAIDKNAKAAPASANAMGNLNKELIKSESSAKNSAKGLGDVEKGLVAGTAAGGGFRAMLGPIAAVLITVGAATALYATNTWGARDAMNEFGSAVGQAVPILKPFGDAIVGILGTLGLTGETAEQTKGHFESMSDGFLNMSTLWNNTVFNMQASNNAFISNLGFTVDAVGQQLGVMGGHFTTQIDASVTTWGTLMDAFARDDYREAVNIIGQALADIPGIVSVVVDDVVKLGQELWHGFIEQLKLIQPGISEGLKDLHGLFAAAWQHMNEAIYKAFQEAGQFIVGFFGEIGARIGSALGTASHIITTWITDNIITPIQNFPSQISIGAQMIWDAIIAGGTDILQTVGTWLINNVVFPINNLHTQITGIPHLIIHNLLSGEWIGNLTSWITSVSDHIATLPNYIGGVAGDIVHNLLSGNYLQELVDWASNVWASLNAEWHKFVTGQGGGNVTQTASGQLQQEIEAGQLDKNKAYNLRAIEPKSAKYQEELGLSKEEADIKARATLEASGQLMPETNEPIGQAEVEKVETAEVGFQKRTVPTPETPTTETITTPIPTGTETKPITGIITPETVKQGQKPATVTPQLTPAQQKERHRAGVYKRRDEILTARAEQGIGGEEINPYQYALSAEDEDVQKSIADTLNIGESFETYKKINEDLQNLIATTNAYNQLLGNVYGQEIIAATGTEKRRNELTMANAALIESRAYNDEYANQLRDGEILQTAFNQGIEDQRKALMDQQTALAHSEGMTAQLNEQMKSGVPQFLAFKEGVDQQKNSLIDMQLETENTRGRIEELGSQLENNQIQAHAWMSGYENAKLAAMEMQVAAFNLQGEVAYLGESLSNNADILARQNISFLENKKSAIEWGMSLQSSLTANDGFREGLIKTAHALGVTLPETFTGTNEDFQTFISLSARAGEAFDSFIEGIESSASNVLSNLGSALTQSNEAFSEAVDKLEEEWGVEFDEGIRNVFESNAGVESIGQTMGNMFTALRLGKEQITDPEFFNGIRKEFAGKFKETWEDIEEETTPAIDTALTNLYNIMNRPVTMTNEGITGWMADVQLGLEELRRAGGLTAEEFATSLGSLNELNFDTVKESLASVGKEITHVDEATGYFVTTTGELVDASGKVQEGIAGTGDAAATATPKTQAFYDTLASFGGLGAVIQTIFETNFPTHVETGTATALGHFETFKTDAEAILNSIDMSGLSGEMKAPEGESGVITPDNTGGGEGESKDAASGFLSQLKTQLNEIPVLMTNAFNLGYQNSVGVLNMLTEYIAISFTTWTANINAISVIFTEAFNLSYQNSVGVLNLLTEYIAISFTTWAANINAVPVIFTAAFNTGYQNAAGSLNSLTQYIAQSFTTWAANIRAISVVMTQAFNTGGQNAAGVMNNLRGHVATVMGQIGTVVNTVMEGVANAFIGAGNAAIQVMSGVDAAARVAAYAVGQIGVLARTSIGAVNDLADALEALPNIERTITYTIVTVGSPPAQAGSPGILGYQGHQVIVGENGREFVQLSKLAEGGIAIGDVNQQGFITNGMMRMTIPEDAMMTVVPLEGRNAQQFGKKYPAFKPLQNALKFENGIVTSGNTSIKRGNQGFTITIDGEIIIEDGAIKDFQEAVDEFGDNVNDQNQGGGTGTGTGTGNIPGSGGASYIPGAGKPCPACTPNSGGTGGGNAGGGSTGGGSGQFNYQQNINGVEKYYRYNNGQIDTNMSQEEIDNANIPPQYRSGSNTGGGSTGGGTNTPGTGSGNVGNGNTGGGTGNGNGTGTSSDFSHIQTSGGSRWYKNKTEKGEPEDWRVVPMEDDPSKYKIINKNNNKNIAAGFSSVDEAVRWVEHTEGGDFVYNENGQTIARGNVGNGNGTGGGTGSGNVGNGGGSTYQRRPDTGPDGVYSDSPHRKYAGTADIGISPAIRNKLARTPGINARNEVELTNGDRYTIEEWNALPDAERAELAEEYGFFAIPEGSYLHEDYSITAHHYQRPLNSRSGPNPHDPNATRASGSTGGTGTGNVGGGTGGSSATPQASNLQLLRIKDTGIEANVSAPAGTTYPKAKSGRAVYEETGASIWPENWFIERQSDGRYKVVDGQGRDVAVDFETWQDAHDWINYVIAETERKTGEEVGANTLPVYKDVTTGKVYAQTPQGELIEQNASIYDDDYITDPNVKARPIKTSTTGGNTGNGNVNPNGSMTPSEATAAGGTQEGYVKPGGWGANDNPEEWEVTRMKDDPDQWKVVDSRGRNVRTNFISQEAAQDYIDARKNNGQGVDNSNITPQSQPQPNTGTGNVNTGPTATGATGGTANTPNQNVTGGSGQPQGQPNTNTGTGTGNVQQSQVISQNSTVNQGNQSNVDLQSGQNSRLRIQNGQVVEATGIYAGYKIGDPLPGLGGGSGTGGTGDNIDVWTKKPVENELSRLMARMSSNFVIPEMGFDPMATQPSNYDDFIEPLVREFGFNPSTISGGDGSDGGDGGTGGGGSGNNPWSWVFKIFEKMTGLMDILLGKKFNTQGLWQDASNITAKNIGSYL